MCGSGYITRTAPAGHHLLRINLLLSPRRETAAQMAEASGQQQQSTPSAGSTASDAKPGSDGSSAGQTPAGSAADVKGIVGAAAAPRSAPDVLIPEPAASAADIPAAEYGTVAWVLNDCLVLIGNRAFNHSDLKKHMLQVNLHTYCHTDSCPALA